MIRKIMTRKLFLLLFLLFLLFTLSSFAQNFSGQSGGDVFVLPPFRMCVGADNGKQMCFKQTGANLARADGALDFQLPTYTVATLPAAAANSGRIYRVSDGTSSSDCTAGGGATFAVCVSNGVSYAAVALGGAGGLPAGVALGSNLVSNGVGIP